MNKPQGWGATEHDARLADIAEVKAGRMSLAEAQANARARQHMAGLSHAQATLAVSDHCRELRREQARTELLKARGETRCS